MLLQISFSQVDAAKGFDVWIDDLTFDIEKKPASNFGQILTKAAYDEMFKSPIAVFTYDGLVKAVADYGQGQLALAGADLDRKHEAAAFLAQITHETGSLQTARELACYPTYTPKCATTDQYYGRGAMQLTHAANYQAAAGTFGGIVENPDRVATETSVAFGTAVWFWMNKGCHGEIQAQNFGRTTAIINGGIECGTGHTGPAERAELYKQFCAAFGINVRGNLGC
jgi:predicted chitinase